MGNYGNQEAHAADYGHGVLKMPAVQSLLLFFLVILVVMAGGGNALAIEEAKYSVIKSDGKFEVRDYAPHVLAETVVQGDLEGAGNTAFSRLFQYISGNNQAKADIAMTAPVAQTSEGEKIEMTAPVSQRPVKDQWAVSFMMPASYTIQTLPQPLDPKVKLREVPAQRIAAVRYSGFWSEKGYRQNETELNAWIAQSGLKAIGEPVWARYNAPFSLWFLRRNEILIPVAGK